MFMTRKLWGLTKRRRWQFLLFNTLFFFANIVNFFQPLVIALLLNTVQEEGGTRQGAKQAPLTPLPICSMQA